MLHIFLATPPHPHTRPRGPRPPTLLNQSPRAIQAAGPSTPAANSSFPPFPPSPATSASTPSFPPFQTPGPPSQVSPRPHLAAPNAGSINYVCSQARERPYSRHASGASQADSTPSRGTNGIPALSTTSTPTVCPVSVNLRARSHVCVLASPALCRTASPVSVARLARPALSRCWASLSL